MNVDLYKWLRWLFFRAALCSVLSSTVFSQPIDISDHPLPLIDGFSDPAPEGLLQNPALLTSYPNGWAAAEYERLFWGFGEKIQRNGISAVYNSCCRGIGVFASILSAPIESRFAVNAAFTTRLHKALTTTIAEKHWGFFVGAGAGIVGRGYNTSAMALAEPDPLFASGKTSKYSISMSLGAAYRQKFGQVFAGAYNLTLPDLAIGSESDRIMPAFQIGGTYRIGTAYLWAVVQYSPRYGDIWLDLDPILAASMRATKYSSLQAFASTHSTGIGLAITPTYDWGPAIIYRLSYPLDGIGVPTHRFGIQLRPKPPAPLFPDVQPIGWKIEGKPIPGETLSVALYIANTGNFRTPEVPVAIKITGEKEIL